MQTHVQDRIVFGAVVAALALVVGTLAVALTHETARPTLTAASAAVVPLPAASAATASPAVIHPAVPPASVSASGSTPEPVFLDTAAGAPARLLDLEVDIDPWTGPVEIEVEAAADEVAAPAPVETSAPEAPEAVAQRDDTERAGTVEIDHHLAEIPDPPQVGGSDTERSFEIARPADPSDPWAGVRRCESHNNYSINTGNGFYGAYQFTISTWNWVAEIIGRSDLIGVRPDLASPADQDRMAQALAFEVPGGGLSHWPVCGRYYG